LQWAQQQGVIPPKSFLDRVTAVAKKATANQPSCCENRPARPSSEPTPGVNRVAKIVLIWKAAECQGIQYIWEQLAEISIPIPNRSTLNCFISLYWLIIADELAISCHHRPDPPIP
jgi:hypothetical protein